MHKNTVIAIISILAVMLCVQLDSWNVMPSMKKAYAVIDIPFCLFLVYYVLWRKTRSAKKKSLLSDFMKYYLFGFQIVGWAFLIVGAILFPFTLIVQANKSDYWSGILLDVSAISIGAISIIITRVNLFR